MVCDRTYVIPVRSALWKRVDQFTMSWTVFADGLTVRSAILAKWELRLSGFCMSGCGFGFKTLWITCHTSLELRFDSALCIKFRFAFFIFDLRRFLDFR